MGLAVQPQRAGSQRPSPPRSAITIVTIIISKLNITTITTISTIINTIIDIAINSTGSRGRSRGSELFFVALCEVPLSDT